MPYKDKTKSRYSILNTAIWLAIHWRRNSFHSNITLLPSYLPERIHMKYLIQLLRMPEPARAQALIFQYQNTWNIGVEKTSEFEFWVKNFKLFSQTFDAMDEDGYLYACYYVSLIVIGSFFVLNLVLGVLSGWVLRINCFHHKINDRVTDTRQTLDARVRKNWSQIFFKISLLASHAIIVIIVFIT